MATHRPLLLRDIESSALRRPLHIAVCSPLELPDFLFRHIGYIDIDTC